MADPIIPPPPPGFTLDAAPAPAQDWSKIPPPPEGFVIDGAPQDNRSGLQIVGDAASRAVGAASTLRLSDIVKGVAKSAADAVQLPGDVYSGRVDPQSEEGFERSLNLSGFMSPGSAGARIRQVQPAPASPLARDAAEAGVTLTAGQKTGSPSLLAKEDAAFGGGLGARAQEIAQAARARQTDELFRARDNIGEVAGRGVANLERAADAGGIVADAVKANAATARQGFKQKYDTAFSSTGTFKPEAFQGLSGRITDTLVNKAEPVIIDDVLTPAANRALRELDNIQNLKLGTTGQPAAGEAIAGVNLRGVDQARRKLVAFYNAAKQNPTDARAVQGIIREFDDQIEQAVTKGLFEGDEAFLGALKDARASYASYQRTFKPQGAGDDVGRVLNTMVQREVTPEQVANYIYGSSKVGANPTNVRVVGRLKELLGENSPEWAAIRQGAWQKIVNVAEGRSPMGGQKASERILDFTRGEGKTFAERLFTKEEINLMNRHAAIEKATAARAGTTNPSNSGNRLAGLLRDSFANIGGMLGMSTGGPQGAAAGYAAGKAAGAIGEMSGAAQARQMFAGQEPISISRRLAGDVTGRDATRRLIAPAAVEMLPGKRESRQ